MTTLKSALELAAAGFYVFPLKRRGKTPALAGWQEAATRDPDRIRELWQGRDYNVGISTTHFGDDQSLVVVDVDTKDGKGGDQTLLRLELAGDELPRTAEQTTASGGFHLIYQTPTALRQGADTLGKGLDIRSRGGFIVGPGSVTPKGAYAWKHSQPPVEAPEWLVKRLGIDSGAKAANGAAVPELVNGQRAENRAMIYLASAPLAVEGDAGDSTTYKVAATLKDFGCSCSQAWDLMSTQWNHRCSPPWSAEELAEKVTHAYKYGRQPVGVAAPELAFAQAEAAPSHPVEKAHPFVEMNKEFAFIKKGAFVLQETVGPRGEFTTEHLSVSDMHSWFANVPWKKGERKVPISQCWMEWGERRQYEGVVFMPEQDPGPRWYNLWRGFAAKPVPIAAHPSVDAFCEHALKNVCNGDEKLCHWLLGYFAHMIQRPWEKPLTALVFKGRKGTGKNALCERVGALLGDHFLVADDDRYLLSNFNSHLETCLFFVLDEAAWAGDKRAEGRLKGLITGTRHNIERKGQEPYRVDNLTRVVILGNEEWLVPATHDERRYAVFNVGEGRMKDKPFFEGMRKQMEAGGYAHLLRFFMDFDLSDVDVDSAPITEGLLDQKHASLELVDQWWLDCLASGHIAGGDWGGAWPDFVPTNRLREALARWARARNIRSRLPEEIGFGKALAKAAPSFRKKRVRAESSTDTSYAYRSPGIEQLRADWEHYMGGRVEWEPVEV